MPHYGYRCQSCQREFEVLQRMSDPVQAACPECGGSGTRLFYPAGILFKGSGFYKTDSRGSAPEPAAGDGAKPAEGDSVKPAAGDSVKPAAGDGAKPATEPSSGPAKPAPSTPKPSTPAPSGAKPATPATKSD